MRLFAIAPTRQQPDNKGIYNKNTRRQKFGAGSLSQLIKTQKAESVFTGDL
jgi:hypothetical protein